MPIALLEVSALLRSAVGEALSRSGRQVSLFAEPSEFLHHVESVHPAAAVLDLHGLSDGLHLLASRSGRWWIWG
jgi:DNA-binding response OmpR family regulator